MKLLRFLSANKQETADYTRFEVYTRDELRRVTPVTRDCDSGANAVPEAAPLIDSLYESHCDQPIRRTRGA